MIINWFLYFLYAPKIKFIIFFFFNSYADIFLSPFLCIHKFFKYISTSFTGFSFFSLFHFSSFSVWKRKIIKINPHVFNTFTIQYCIASFILDLDGIENVLIKFRLIFSIYSFLNIYRLQLFPFSFILISSSRVLRRRIIFNDLYQSSYILINANYMKKISSYKKVSSSCLFNIFILSVLLNTNRNLSFFVFFSFAVFFFLYITLKRGNRVYLAKKQWLV